MSNKRNLESPPAIVPIDSPIWKRWFLSLFNRVANDALVIKGYAVDDVPDAGNWASNTADGTAFSSLIYIYDDAHLDGLYVLAYSNGTNWIRVDNGAAIS